MREEVFFMIMDKPSAILNDTLCLFNKIKLLMFTFHITVSD